MRTDDRPPLIPTGPDCGLAEGTHLILDAAWLVPSAFAAAYERESLAKLGKKNRAEPYKGRSHAADRGGLVHLLANRLTQRACVPDRDRMSIPLGLHRAACDWKVDDKRLSTAAECAADFGWMAFISDRNSIARRAYRRRVFMTCEGLTAMGNVYLPYATACLQVQTREKHWRAAPDGERALATAHGFSPRDAAYVLAAYQLRAAWDELIETMGVAKRYQPPATKLPAIIESPFGPAAQRHAEPPYSEIAFALALTLVLTSILPNRLGRNSAISYAKIAQPPQVTVDRLAREGQRLIDHGWAKPGPNKDSLSPTPLLLSDFLTYFVPAVERIFSPAQTLVTSLPASPGRP